MFSRLLKVYGLVRKEEMNSMENMMDSKVIFRWYRNDKYYPAAFKRKYLLVRKDGIIDTGRWNIDKRCWVDDDNRRMANQTDIVGWADLTYLISMPIECYDKGGIKRSVGIIYED